MLQFPEHTFQMSRYPLRVSPFVMLTHGGNKVKNEYSDSRVSIAKICLLSFAFSLNSQFGLIWEKTKDAKTKAGETVQSHPFYRDGWSMYLHPYSGAMRCMFFIFSRQVLT